MCWIGEIQVDKIKNFTGAVQESFRLLLAYYEREAIKVAWNSFIGAAN